MSTSPDARRAPKRYSTASCSTSEDWGRSGSPNPKTTTRSFSSRMRNFKGTTSPFPASNVQIVAATGGIMLFRASVSFTALLYGAAVGQTLSETKPKFEVADIHGSPPTTQPFVRGPFEYGGRYELRFAAMLDLIRTAYGV